MINLGFLLVALFGNEGLSFYDDFTYLKLAHDITTGTFEVTTDPFTARIALLYPAAWLIQLFGISAYTMTFFPLLCALLLLNALLWYGHQQHHVLGIVAALLFLPITIASFCDQVFRGDAIGLVLVSGLNDLSTSFTAGR